MEKYDLVTIKKCIEICEKIDKAYTKQLNRLKAMDRESTNCIYHDYSYYDGAAIGADECASAIYQELIEKRGEGKQ